ncbi:MAG: response regulator [Candidatus Hydrogenedentes bacterium]|nr:response regulator [Candidatus Hydrogenedentota bacterium]
MAKRDKNNGERKISVLIAEDSPTQAARLQFLLESDGYATTVAKDGEEALAAAAKCPPDLLVSDIVMPKMNGYELARCFRCETSLSHIPIILLTTLSDPHDIILGLECGADNFLRKPYEEEYLLQRINYILTNRQLRKRERVQMGIEIDLAGTRHFITAERQQIFDLLISTYEEAVHLNSILEQSNQSLNGLYRVAEGLNQCSSEHEVLERVLERATELPCVSAGWIFVRNESGVFRVAASRGLSAVGLEEGGLNGECVCKRRFLSGDLERVANLSECELLAEASAGHALAGCHASIPLRVNDAPHAILNLVNASCRRFTEEEVRILHGVAYQTGLALERARLHAQLELLVAQRTRELEEKSAQLGHLLATSPTIIYALAWREGGFVPVWTSENVARITGWSTAEAMEPRWLQENAHPEDLDIVLQNNDVLLRDGFLIREYRVASKDGAYIWMHDEQRLLRDEAGAPLEVVGSRIDITQRKNAEEALKRVEEQFYQAQKLDSIGSLAGGIAHDMNNVLSAISGYTELVMNELTEENPLYDDLKHVQDAGQHGAKLVSQILAFSRKQLLRPRVLDLNEIIGDFTSMMQRLIGEDIEIFQALTPDLFPVLADSVQMEQILMNLVINARDAMPHGGRLTLETLNVELDACYVSQHPQAEPGHYVLLAVSDTGCGMDRDTQQRIFDPFFTTKEVGKGTGLGLATVYGIVKQHNGNIWVYSEPGQGTTFKIYLPVPLDCTLDQVDAPSEAVSRGGTETILVVEDNDNVRQLMCDSLRMKGYTVQGTSRPQEALAIAGGESGKIHLLLADIVLPGMNGKELYHSLRGLIPDLKVLYVSGYTHDVISRHGILEKNTDFLQKPFTINGLLGSVRKALDATSGGT